MKNLDATSTVDSSPMLCRLGAVLALFAAGLAGYLAVLGFLQGAAPPGCGSGSGCGEVLSSRWSSLFGLPVSLPALVVYLMLSALLLRGKPHPLIGFLSGCILGGVFWFVLVQIFFLKELCAYCMADHVLGGAAAVLALCGTRFSCKALGGGLLLAGGFITLQLLQPVRVHALDLPVGRNVDLVVGGKRYVTLMEGSFQFEVAAEPHFGSADAERIVLLAVDYACPHCRKLHALALEQLANHPEALCVIVLPTPIHPSCNPAMETVPERFRESCDIAALSLAVHRENPALWREFDRWLFDTEGPRSLAESREKALSLLGALPETMNDPRLQRNIDLFAAMPVEEASERRVPVTWWVHQPPVIGPIHDGNLLWQRAAPSTNLSE